MTSFRLPKGGLIDRASELSFSFDGKSFMAQARLQPAGSVLTADYMFDYSKFDQRPDYAQLVRVNRNGDPRDIFDPASPSYPFAGAFFPLNLYTNPDRQRTGSIDGNPLAEKSRTYGHALTLTAELDAVTLKSVTAYRNLRFSDELDLDGSPLPVAYTARFTRLRRGGLFKRVALYALA